MLEDLRSKIDRIDREIVGLLNDRAEVALEIGDRKKQLSLDIVDSSREKEVITGVKKLNGGPFSDGQIADIFTKIISKTKNLEREVC